ncbi:type III-B CRISPR module-associated Cmr3 family protein [Lipingzhangella sp. LS1_29]|uniref:Type III-B CRISPR module-associated Cmr3 family protein n=1 Tax=Lipingzhangella rawalii TaxID=2055835 RepID=A0ABU2H4C5_9ACTN|nr:type III-B CRISPR module-associated Cmr3 family protein [Lipingzhangella rawalii]MDS1269709.1 type III-B CRISPR module-associated Cmr3 family protein [Lipingzhangella rawalii]
MSSTSTAVSTWLALRPQDSVHVRDGRPFVGGTGGSAHTVRPGPTTVAGAIGAACHQAGAHRNPAAVRGPLLAEFDPEQGWRSYLPMPRDLVRTDTNKARTDTTDGTDQALLQRRHLPSDSAAPWAGVVTDLHEKLTLQGRQPLHPLHLHNVPGKTEPMTGWGSSALLRNYLHGDTLTPGASKPVPASEFRYGATDPLVSERRLGLALDDHRIARTGMLYQTTHWRLQYDWAFLAEVEDLPCADEQLPHAVGFGGAGRLAELERIPGMHWPDAPLAFPDGQLLLYLATPAAWAEGWLPPIPAEVSIVAAALGDPHVVSTATADPNRRQRLSGTRRFTTVPAGSVYWLRFPSAQAAVDWSHDHHGRALGPAVDERLDTAGFGIVLTGVW